MITPSYMSNDRFIWTSDKPDAELIEPEILASVDKNWLTFGLQVQGVVFGRQLHALPFVRTTNSTTITVYRRPTNAFKVDEDYPYIRRTELYVLPFITSFHPSFASVQKKRFPRSTDSLQTQKRSFIHLFGTSFSLENSADIRV
uniref:Uncharacterized protein n=1 Tax=Loa loa TaxID=7209 RepID=A0A1I7VKI0_LOALO